MNLCGAVTKSYKFTNILCLLNLLIFLNDQKGKEIVNKKKRERGSKNIIGIFYDIVNLTCRSQLEGDFNVMLIFKKKQLF